jgi:hypothetical protein
MVELRDDDLVAGLPRPRETAREMKGQRRHVEPKRDLVR